MSIEPGNDPLLNVELMRILLQVMALSRKKVPVSSVEYVERLRRAGTDVQITIYPNAGTPSTTR